MASALALGIVFLPALAAAQSNQGSAFTVLYSFTGKRDGAAPQASLLLDAGGNLYGTTYAGGADDCGVVFKLDPNGNETVVYSFNWQKDAGYPWAKLIQDSAGNLYGATEGGETHLLGAVFKVDTAGRETVLHKFTARDGESPFAGLVRDAAGNLYGTTEGGGRHKDGIVFKLDPHGNEKVLYSFAGAPDGDSPYGDLIRDAAGNLYGTTRYGGASNYGTVFKLDPSTGQETVLYSFTGGEQDGRYPNAGLIANGAGGFYGTTVNGADGDYGVVFKLDAAGNETVLYSFGGGKQGAYPYGGLIRDRAGNLYGTTFQGGDSNYGVVFKVDPSGNETVLHSFSGGLDGAYPYAALIRDDAGDLYGTTTVGGAGGAGTVFKIAP
jgi:uncharacterized repeat protein (TIGR03803 family)